MEGDRVARGKDPGTRTEVTLERQRGIAILESVVAAAVLAIAVGGALFAFSSFGRYSSHQAGPVRTAATALAEQTLRLAQNAWKYGAVPNAPSGSVSASVPVIVPGAAATSAPVTVTAAIVGAGAEGAQLTVTVRYTPDPGHPSDPGVVSVSGAATVLAPPPGSHVLAATPIPAPSGAP